MIKHAIVATALLAGTSAYAQDTTSTTATDQVQPAGPAQQSTTTQPTDPTTTTTTTQPTDTTTTATGTQPAPTDQTTVPSGTQLATPADPSTGTPATPATPASPAQTATTSDQPATDPVVATVEADWAKYDANSGGTLSRTEFNKWVSDLQTAADKKAPTSSYLRSAFRKADADKNGSISKEELQTFLRG